MNRPSPVTDHDVRSAQAALDAWGVPDAAGQITVDRASLLELRGILAGWAADVREAGYVEGLAAGRVDGRRALGRWLRDLLEAEGA